jgi:hypothetical protein
LHQTRVGFGERVLQAGVERIGLAMRVAKIVSKSAKAETGAVRTLGRGRRATSGRRTTCAAAGGNREAEMPAALVPVRAGFTASRAPWTTQS